MSIADELIKDLVNSIDIICAECSLTTPCSSCKLNQKVKRMKGYIKEVSLGEVKK